MDRVKGKVALVTGAGGGQGAAEVKLLVAEGAQVIATDLNLPNVERVAAEINAAYPGRVIAAAHDVANENDWKRVCQLALDTFGPIDVLVNNAGILLRVSYQETTYEQWKRSMDINAWGTFIGIRSVVPQMKQAGGGSIINIASMAVVNSCGHFTAYTASKGAVDAFSRAAAVELGADNIRVNSVNPGIIQTQMLEEAGMTAEMLANAAAAHPLGRCGAPTDVAYLILYLASDESRFTSGTSQNIDGGRAVIGGVRPLGAGVRT
jgi:NAD(P)-dependent dehydrogenase (short-subunit alcohol dehydrogenase family)